MTDRAADTLLDYLELFIRLVVFALDSLAQRRVLHFVNLFGVGPGRHLAPCWTRIVEVPMLQREREAGTQRGRLTEDRKALFATALEPCKAPLMDLGIVPSGSDRIMQNRTIRFCRQPFQEIEVVFDFAGRLRDLDETFVA